MARTVNRVTLLGYIADEPVIRPVGNDNKVANVTLVTNENTRNSQTGQWEEIPEWHRVVAWGRLADVIGNYVHKGSKLYVEGRLRTQSYTDNSGIKRKSTEIIASEIIFGDSRGGGSGDYQGGNRGGYQGGGYNNGSDYQNGGRGGYNNGYQSGGYNNGNDFQGGNRGGQNNNFGNYQQGGRSGFPNDNGNNGGGFPGNSNGYGEWSGNNAQGSAQQMTAPQAPSYQGIGQGMNAQAMAPSADNSYTSPYGSSGAPSPSPFNDAQGAPSTMAAPAPSAPMAAPAAPIDNDTDDEVPF